MLPIASYNKHEVKTVQKACSYLFSADKIFDFKFLKTINEFILKQAYLKQIKYCHPETSRGDSEARKKKKLEFLNKARQSYDFLLNTVNNNSAIETATSSNSKIIAVGGAKGGIGKSMFTANISVYLASKGFKTIAIDLDLGGANLSLYLGEKFILERTINDFLSKKFDSLTDIAIQSKYGPIMIGGDSSELGAANIHYTRKIKLMKAIRELQADYIILDLGGDTSYNMLDFFLLADCNLVMTTKDSAAYIGAYQFLKTAVYRKFNRISGPEAGEEMLTDKNLSTIIKESTQSGSHVQSISELLKKIAEFDPLDLPAVLNVLINFNPYLIVNRVTRAVEAQQVVQSIKSLTQKALSIQIDCPGVINRIPEIEDNLRNFAPMITRKPTGQLARDIDKIARNIEIM